MALTLWRCKTRHGLTGNGGNMSIICLVRFRHATAMTRKSWRKYNVMLTAATISDARRPCYDLARSGSDTAPFDGA